MQLPTEPRKAVRNNPKELVIFGKPKCGKTTTAAELTRSGKWLLLELEDGGADFVEATTLQANSYEEIQEIGKAIKEAKFPYEGIIVDTVTKLEELALPLAAKLYKESPMGVNWMGDDVRKLPKGSGYLYLRQAYFKLIDFIRKWADHIIFLGHLSDKQIDKAGEEVSSKELDLTGKISSLMCARADAIAYCYRFENQTILNFRSSESVVCGARADHLKGQEIVIAESDDKGNMEFHWDKVFIND